ncbi:amidohydrolase [Streptomyces bathyalis]|uniref:Amidohydrolase n=1 Tax=Streptomyces bathyalis TaxID=2710756 RepID=A0A7T1TC36_9ACTN|nr:amidohydrolase [Streptomyces bathyalis]QPP10233.1 amidohydrolase [Streptomyces bathyalis]
MSTAGQVTEVKRAVREAVERSRDRVLEISADVQRHPETGFREERSAALVADWFTGMELPFERGLSRTGVKARMTGGGSGPTVAVLGELDALLLPSHPLADPGTGAAHACGHHAQIASMVGAAAGLAAVQEQLDGDVVFFAVPAEESTELAWRRELVRAGELRHLVGKADLIARGAFDDIDMAMLCHTAGEGAPRLSVGDSHNGSVVKQVLFQGRASHAGASPWRGVNALKSATLALAAIDAQRDTFRDEDAVRVNAVLPQGGSAPTAVPDRVEMEVVIRARTVGALREACAAVDRAVRAGAVALGTTATTETTLNYLPHHQDPELVELCRANAETLFGPEKVVRGWHRGASTDMGDLGEVMPVLHPFTAGAVGDAHSPDYQVTDHVTAALEPAVLLAWCVVDLLVDGAAEARRIMDAAGRTDEDGRGRQDRTAAQVRDDYAALRGRFDASYTFDGADTGAGGDAGRVRRGED